MKRSFEEIIGSLKESIADYKYHVDFENAYANVEAIEDELNLLNGLIGKDDIEKKFKELTKQYPKIIQVLPILLAVREKKITILDGGYVVYEFNEKGINNSNHYELLYKSGFINLLQNKKIKNLVDYVFGVEAGMSSHGRKIRGGHLMENEVEKYLTKCNCDYLKEATSDDIRKKWGTNILDTLSFYKEEEGNNKRFDFAVKTIKGNFLLIETNFYNSKGSKLTETSRSYSKLGDDIKKLRGLNFVWITDGVGWRIHKKNLKEAYDILDHLYTIKDLEDGIIPKLIEEL